MADIAASARRKAQGTTAVISPLALEMVRRIDALFEIERAINGQKRRTAPSHPARTERTLGRRSGEVDARAAAQAVARQRCRQGDGLHAQALACLHPVSRRRGRICLSNNAAERALRGIALGRKSWLFAGSDCGGQRAAAMFTLIVTAKMNNVDPQAWLADVLARIAEHPARKLDELLLWNWRPRSTPQRQAA
jgi:hypothetical protein